MKGNNQVSFNASVKVFDTDGVLMGHFGLKIFYCTNYRLLTSQHGVIERPLKNVRTNISGP